MKTLLHMLSLFLITLSALADGVTPEQLLESIQSVEKRLIAYEVEYAETHQAVEEIINDFRYLLQSAQQMQMANFTMMDVRFRNLEFILGMGLPAQSPPALEQEAPTSPTITKKAPQLFMAPLLRYLRSEEARLKLLDDMEASGLTGLHLVLQTDWFDLEGPLDFQQMGIRHSLSTEAFNLIEDIWHRLQQRNPDYHMHIWLWGDSDWWCNPIRLQGPFGSMERLVYDEINRRWTGWRNMTFGVGWDCYEWLTREHLQQMVAHLQVPLAARGLTYDQFNDVADIPSIEQPRHTTEELTEFRRRYPRDQFPFIISSDRCRQYVKDGRPVEGWRDPDRNFSREAQQRVYEDAVRNDVTVIFGKIRENGEDFGSMRFDRSFNTNPSQ